MNDRMSEGVNDRIMEGDCFAVHAKTETIKLINIKKMTS